MKSIKELYKIGCGPSSSHTMGPEKASMLFKKEFPNADNFIVTLYGSLALTGRGHLTDYIIIETLKPKHTEVIWKPTVLMPKHPNAMKLEAIKDGNSIGEWLVYSVGGGIVEIDGAKATKELNNTYHHKDFTEIREYCISENIDLYQYALRFEDEDIIEHIKLVWSTFQQSVKEGLSQDGVLKGMGMKRKAKTLYEKAINDSDYAAKESNLISAYAFAVNEVNASAGYVVTSPTCGASGTMPALLYYSYHNLNKYSEEDILKSIVVGGIIGNVVKHNASISGAEAGCQAEVGTACSMAAAARAYLDGGDIHDVESSAEIALEHNLGMTCDPIKGLVQAPCIERNAIAANKALNAVRIAMNLRDTGMISFDTVVETMYQTGIDMQSKYRETSEGGLALFYKENK